MNLICRRLSVLGAASLLLFVFGSVPVQAAAAPEQPLPPPPTPANTVQLPLLPEVRMNPPMTSNKEAVQAAMGAEWGPDLTTDCPDGWPFCAYFGQCSAVGGSDPWFSWWTMVSYICPADAPDVLFYVPTIEGAVGLLDGYFVCGDICSIAAGTVMAIMFYADLRHFQRTDGSIKWSIPAATISPPFGGPMYWWFELGEYIQGYFQNACTLGVFGTWYRRC
jgi:hypothetical protein